MTQDQVLLTILGVLVVANVFLVGSIPLRSRRQRRAARQMGVRPGSSAGMADHGDPGVAENVRAAAAIEAFVASVSADTPGRSRPPAR